MRRYLYCYQTVVRFGTAVSNHAILLRCLPREEPFQHCLEQSLIVPPGFRLNRGTDAFGNIIVYGWMARPHQTLAYVSTGIVETGAYQLPDEPTPAPLYLLPTPLTALSADLRVERQNNDIATAQALCAKIHDRLEYLPQSTSVNTPADEVLRLGHGVCQDYAHVFIAACRQMALPARYVCGLMEGTGVTHAWAEVLAGGREWVAFDPTNNLRIDHGYIKLAHGRDAADCDVSRGLYTGATSELTTVSVQVVEL